MQRRQAQNLLVTQHSCMTSLHISIIGYLLKKKKKAIYLLQSLVYCIVQETEEIMIYVETSCQYQKKGKSGLNCLKM